MILSNIAMLRGGGAQKSYPEHIGKRQRYLSDLIAFTIWNFFNLKVDHIFS